LRCCGSAFGHQKHQALVVSTAFEEPGLLGVADRQLECRANEIDVAPDVFGSPPRVWAVGAASPLERCVTSCETAAHSRERHPMNDVQEHILRVLREWRDQDRKVLASIEGGKARWHRGDVDITAEALATTKKRIAETENLIRDLKQRS
jgi:hypothetical protein